MDKDKSGEISREEFQSIPGIEENPLTDRVFSLVDLDKSNAIDFEEFIRALSLFSGEGNQEGKLRC